MVATQAPPPIATSTTNPMTARRRARPSSSADSSRRSTSGVPNMSPGTTIAARETPVESIASSAFVGRIATSAARPQRRATRHSTRSSAVPTTAFARVSEKNSQSPAVVNGLHPGSRSENTRP